jgi:hypothetical protein
MKNGEFGEVVAGRAFSQLRQGVPLPYLARALPLPKVSVAAMLPWRWVFSPILYIFCQGVLQNRNDALT